MHLLPEMSVGEDMGKGAAKPYPSGSLFVAGSLVLAGVLCIVLKE